MATEDDDVCESRPELPDQVWVSRMGAVGNAIIFSFIFDYVNTFSYVVPYFFPTGKFNEKYSDRTRGVDIISKARPEFYATNIVENAHAYDSSKILQ